MADTRSEEDDSAFPVKRKPDLTCSNADGDPPTKTPKMAYKINGGTHADAGAGTGETEVDDAPGRSGADLEEEEEEKEERDEKGLRDYGFDEVDEEDYDVEEVVEDGG